LSRLSLAGAGAIAVSGPSPSEVVAGPAKPSGCSGRSTVVGPTIRVRIPSAGRPRRGAAARAAPVLELDIHVASEPTVVERGDLGSREGESGDLDVRDGDDRSEILEGLLG